MSRLMILTVACALVSQYAQGDEDVDLMREPIENLALREGNCSKAIPGGRVFEENINLLGVPSGPRNTTISWSGERKMYCILALNRKDASEGSTIFVKEGGIDHTFITLEMHSEKNYGLAYIIQVFAK